MLLSWKQFAGELPKVEPRLLPSTHAYEATNCKFETGAITPFKKPILRSTLGSDAQTIYRLEDGSWLSWNAEVDVVPGPVKQDRLYITGNGVPKVRMENGTTYNLAVPTPAAAPTVQLRRMNEWLTVDGKEVALIDGRTAKSSGYSVNIAVKVRNSTATITITHPTGLSESQAQGLVNGLRYRAYNNGATLVTSQKIVRLTRLKDDGGQTLDANRNPIGSDTRLLEGIGSVVNIHGASTIMPPAYVWEDAPAQDNTNYAGQNDPPTLSTTGVVMEFYNGDPARVLFSGTAVSTIESGQSIILLEVVVEGLSNGRVDPDLQESMAYVYTYVTSFDEESGPSPLSDRVRWSPGGTIRVFEFSPAPAGRAIDRIRVYRSITSAQGVTDLYFVAEIASNANLFDDQIDYIPAGEQLPSLDYSQPVDGLKGIISMPNGMMAAFQGRELFFCEPYRPHAWPAKYSLALDADIVGLAAFGSTLAVMTKRHPVIVQCTHPENASSEKIEVNLPCLSKRSIVDMGYFAVYASTEGIVTISNQGAQLVSQALFTDRQWRDMNISSFVCSKHQGRYIISHDDLGSPAKRRCTIIDMTGADPYVIRTTWEPNAFFFRDGGSDLYFLKGKREIYQFDTPTGENETYRWKSKPIVLPTYVSFASIRMDADRPSGDTLCEVKVYGDDDLIHTERTRNTAVRMRGGSLRRRWQVEVVADVPFKALWLANSPAEIARDAS